MLEKQLPSVHSSLRLLPLLAGILLLASCSKDNVSGPNRVPLTLRAMGTGSASGAPALGARALVSADYAAAGPADTIPVTFTRALLVVRDVRFVLSDREEGEESDSLDENDSTEVESDSTGDHEDEGGAAVIYRGPFVVDLLTQTADSLDTQLVPPGLYHQIMGHLAALRAGDWNASQFSFLIGSTVLLEGSVNGDGGGPFTFQSRIDDEFILKGPFDIQAGQPATAFLTFDVSRFLRARDGSFLDPRIAGNAKWIEDAIRHAIKVRMDDNHNGRMDD